MKKEPSKHIKVPPLGARGLFSLGGRVLLWVLLFSIVIAVYYMVNPEGVWWFPKCGLYQMTGLKCPICGAQRALHQILHGNILAAVRLNYFLPFTLLYWFAVLACHRRNLTRVFYFYCLLAFVWGIVRNVVGL